MVKAEEQLVRMNELERAVAITNPTSTPHVNELLANQAATFHLTI